MARWVREIRLESIEPNRRYVVVRETIEMLCRSISEQGQLEPIRIIRRGNAFRILDGEKRWRACRILRRKTIIASIEEME
jgi:ParB family chromosome partitioning protein